MTSLILVPSFDICNADKLDGGLTKDELHSAECKDFIASVGGDNNFADEDFEFADSDGNGVVSIEEFIAGAKSLIDHA